MTVDTYAAALALCSDDIVQAVHAADPARIQAAIEQAFTLTAPDGTNPAVALITILAAQIIPGLPVELRLLWVEGVAA
jgi:hypothetical protein